MLSILTNFGCHWGCPYCVYRENKIKIPKTDKRSFDFEALEKEIINMDGDEISISGGGDPLFDWRKNSWFYDKIFSLCKKYNKKVELHTTYIDYDFYYKNFNRVVFHLSNPTQIRLIRNGDNKLSLPSNVRIVFVLQNHYTRGLINQIVIESNNNEDITELVSFRQLIDKNGKAIKIEDKYLNEMHKKRYLYYIKQNDYNEYFVNNHIEKEYLKIK